MCDLICDIVICCVWSCNMGKIDVYDKITIENQKKTKIWKSEKFHISLLNRWLRNGIHSLLRRADAWGSADIITVCDAYCYFVGQAKLLTSKSRSRREYLVPMDNIIMVDHFFNLTKKSNLIVRLIWFYIIFW